MRRTPLSYQGNHNALVPDGTAVDAPPYGHDLDYELEIGFVVSRDVRDQTAAECGDAIGGLVILNDISLRDTQWEEARGNPLGPVQKCKSFATAISSEVLTVEEPVDDISWLTGSVDVDGETWSTGRADDFAHTLPECLARLSEGEMVLAGELLSTGTLAGCSGIELGRLPPAGAEVTLTVDEIGRLTNRLGDRQ
jgi:2-keto-4-pentenoate hydratase/2-oxohepta-3-ene-1,7-dioic acid hydratase in catechol pathway